LQLSTSIHTTNDSNDNSNKNDPVHHHPLTPLYQINEKVDCCGDDGNRAACAARQPQQLNGNPDVFTTAQLLLSATTANSPPHACQWYDAIVRKFKYDSVERQRLFFTLPKLEQST
jgi:hypothetical protein